METWEVGDTRVVRLTFMFYLGLYLGPILSIIVWIIGHLGFLDFCGCGRLGGLGKYILVLVVIVWLS